MGIWFLEGQSSQRDVVAAVKSVFPPGIGVVASHRQHRPEITGMADTSLIEPADADERIEWILETAAVLGVRVVIAGRSGSSYEAAREKFQAAGIDLVTGGLSMKTFDLVDDKWRFTESSLAAGLACVPAREVRTAGELEAAYESMRRDGEVCVKPVVGIYGQGFWRFKESADPFRCFANPDSREVDFETYFAAYKARADRKPLLVMPYLPGQECSVDMVCQDGRVIAYVGRRKDGLFQSFEIETAATDLAVRAAEHFGCDGLVNVQTRDDADGHPHLLEINPRYSGGIGYTLEAGVNLPAIFAAARLGGIALPGQAWRFTPGKRVKSITVAVSA